MSDVSSNGSFKYVQNTLKDSYPKIIPYIRSGNVGNTFINSNELEKISKEAHSKLKLSVTKLHDVMMARKGKIGGASIIMGKEVNYNCNENVIKLTIKDQQKINPFCFTVYFNSKFGLKQIERLSTGNVQPWVSIFQIRKLKYYVFSLDFQQQIEQIVKTAHLQLEQSKALYYESEYLLLEKLGLKDWTPTEEAVNIKTIYDFKNSGRLDAEYYQLKYDKLFETLSKFETKRLSGVDGIVSIKKSIEPGSEAYQDEGIPFLRVANLSKLGLSDTNIYLDRKEYSSMELNPKKDTILLSKDGSVGIAYKVEKDLDFITSGAILHLKIKDKDFLPDYLTLVLNSIVVKMQAERDAGGSIIQHWKPSEIEKVIIPKFSMEIQTLISDKIQESFRLKAESEGLLHLAKLAVETAIEKGEDEALKLFN